MITLLAAFSIAFVTCWLLVKLSDKLSDSKRRAAFSALPDSECMYDYYARVERAEKALDGTKGCLRGLSPRGTNYEQAIENQGPQF